MSKTSQASARSVNAGMQRSNVAIGQIHLDPNRINKRKAQVRGNGIVPAEHTTSAVTTASGADNVFQGPGDAAPGTTVSFGGGSTIANVQVQLIFWGSVWNNAATSPSASQITNAVSTILSGPYMNKVAQYGAGPGTLLGSWILSSPEPNNPFSDSDVGDMVWNLIDNGNFPEPEDGNNNQLLMFIMPQGVVSTTQLGGEHTTAHDQDFFDGDDAPFAWVTNNGNINSITQILSHELVEAASDPAGDAWQVDPRNSTSWHEIGDVCATVATLDGVSVQSYFSASDGGCVIPGLVMGDPTKFVASWGPGRLDICGIGTDRAIWHKAWDGSAWQPPATGWENLGGVFTSPPALVSWGPDRLDIFALGTDSAMWHKAWNGSAWSGWESLGGVFTSPPTVVSWAPNRLDIFGIGTDRAMHHKAWNGSIWEPSLTGWENLGGTFSSPPAVASWAPGRLDIFGLGTDHAMFHKAWDGSNWQPSLTDWEYLGGVFTSQPAVVSWAANRLDIFGLGGDRAMFHKAWDGSNWQPSLTDWEDLGGIFTSQPAVASWASGRLDIFGLGTDHAMFHKAWDGSNWQPSLTDWESLGGTFTTSPPTVVSWAPNRLDIFGLGGDRAMWHEAWNGSAWSGWESLGGTFTAP